MSIVKMQDSEYFSIDAVSNSLLSRYAKCPAATKMKLEPTAAMNKGTCLHSMVLDGTAEFYNRFSVAPECDRRTKEGKALYAQFLAESEGKIPVSMSDLHDVVGMATSIANHPSASELLSSGQSEMAILWDDAETGAAMKAKADFMTHGILIDLKTCQDSSYAVFSKTIVNSGYARQLAMYRDGLRANLFPIERCIIIAVENSAPYTCDVYELDEELLEIGQGQYKRLLRGYLSNVEADVWPAYRYAGISTVYAPQWLKEVEGD